MGLFRQKKKTTDAGEKAEKADADIPPTLMSVLKSVQEMDRKPPVTLALMVAANKEIGAVFIAPFIHSEELYLYQSM
ncbi:hypothetical protein GQ600_4709 [Phytophthora cactorum]|nr:hypothetical protein GQ600_4709 [Phytophthora cactorum]